MSIINQLWYNSIKKPEKLNILSFFFNGTFDIELLKTGHNFYGLLEGSAVPWPGFKNLSFPNLKLLSNINDVKDYGFDLILFQNRPRHEQFFNLTKGLHVPGLVIDHCYEPTNPYFLKKHLEQCKLQSVSTHILTKDQFRSISIIPYNLEENISQFDKDIDILLIGTFTEQHYGLLQQFKRTFPTLKLVGNNPQIPFSEQVETYQDYKNLFKRAKVFINLPTSVSISYELLWALQNKCAIVSLNLPIYENFLKPDNSIVIGDFNHIIPAIQNLVHNSNEFKRLTNYNIDLSMFKSNIEDWNQVFDQYSGVYYDSR